MFFRPEVIGAAPRTKGFLTRNFGAVTPNWRDPETQEWLFHLAEYYRTVQPEPEVVEVREAITRKAA